MPKLDLEGDEPTPPEEAPSRPEKAVAPQKPPGANGAHDADAELYLVSCCMYDIEGNHWPIARRLPVEAFHDAEAKAVWRALQDGLTFANNEAAFLKTTGLSFERAVRIEGLAGLGTGFAGWLGEVRSRWQAEEFLRIAADMEKNPGMDPRVVMRRAQALIPSEDTPGARGLPVFGVPDAADKSVLLGNRFLNRGDAMVISSTSGMGKSSIALQQAVCYALGRPFFGIAPNGPLRSLVIQSEDSEGDIGEVWASLRHCMRLTADEERLVAERVLIVTERVRRGEAFIAELRGLVARHKPDLVWINPLQAYIEGDVTDARDLGDFLRAGLNSLNEPPTFGFIVVHHTTKPATGKDKAERLWHEVMYDMAGGAEIINWARAIMSLRAAGDPGEFNLVLAKRGVRAGVTREVEQGAGVRDEPVTTIPMKHSEELIEIPGHKRRLRCIFWEPRVPSVEETTKTVKRGAGAPREHSFSTYRDAFPKTEETAAGVTRIHAIAKDFRPIGVGAFYKVIADGVDAGAIAVGKDARGRPKYWLKA